MDIREEILTLRRQLEHANFLYYVKDAPEISDFEYDALMRRLEELEAATAGSLRKAVQDGNYEEGTFMSGQIAGMLKELRPCADIIRGMTDEAEQLMKNAYKRFE